MIEQYLSVQDTLIILLLIGIGVKGLQFYYFDKKNKGGRK